MADWDVVSETPAGAALAPSDHDPWEVVSETQSMRKLRASLNQRPWYEGFGTGLRDPVEGGAQLLSHMVPSPVERLVNQANNWLADKTGLVAKLPEGGMDEYERQREASIQAARGGDTGPDWARTAGNVAASLPLGRLGGPLAGGATGALQPVTEGDFWSGKAKQVAEGVVAGSAASGIAGVVARAAAPVLRNAARVLVDEGVTLTPGQVAGGAAKAAEDKATSIPILGDAIAAAQRRSIDTFNRAAINRTLEPIGQRLPRNLVAGREAIAHAGDRIGEVYDRVLPTVQFQLDHQFANDVQSLNSLASYMPPAQRQQFASILKDRVVGRLTGRGGMDGSTTQQVRSELRNFVRNYRSSSDAAQRQLADAVATLDLHLGDAVARQNPAQAAALRAADEAYARLVRVEGAAGRRAISEGRFTPGDLLASIKSGDSSVRHRAFARGDALMQDLAEAAQNVIGNRYPDSGTTGRALFAGGLATALGHPGAVVGLGAGALPYTPPMTNLLRQYLATTPGPGRNALASLVRQGGQYAAPAAALGAQSLVGP